MAIQSGYSRYSCDVLGCDSAVYALPETDASDSYVQRRRIDSDGIEHKVLLCPDHAAAYAEIVRSCDAYYSDFEKTGSVDIVTKADLEAANAATAAMQAKYEKAEKARKWWGDKFRALEEEFNAYKAAHPDTTLGGDDVSGGDA